jgi:hypothetical protein
MPVGAYIGTPATNAGDGTYLTNGLDRLGELSPERPVFAQSQNLDLITQMKNARGNGRTLRTPRAGDRNPLRPLPNPGTKAEFTPLMKSAAKNNIWRKEYQPRTLARQTRLRIYETASALMVQRQHYRGWPTTLSYTASILEARQDTTMTIRLCLKILAAVLTVHLWLSFRVEMQAALSMMEI